MIRIFYIFFLFVVVCNSAIAQQKDSTLNVKKDTTLRADTPVLLQGDTIKMKSYADRFSPRKALLYAAILPGLGQVYNKKYWKLPLVYGAFGYMGYWAARYQQGYKLYKGQLYYNIENGYTESQKNPESDLTTSFLRTTVDRFRRERDFMIILLGGMYLLQMVDAHVDAHLKEFDLNPNLQVSLEPMMEQNSIIGRQGGVSLLIKF